MRALIDDGALTALDANRFCIKAAIVLAFVCGAFEAITLLAGISAQCQLVLPFTDRRLWPFYGLTLTCGVVLLGWIWKWGGDRTLAKVGPAFARGVVRDKRYSPRQVRFWSTSMLVIAWGGFVAMRLTMPTPTPAEMPFCAQGFAAQPAVAADGASPRR